jgi:hypothetical protein
MNFGKNTIVTVFVGQRPVQTVLKDFKVFKDLKVPADATLLNKAIFSAVPVLLLRRLQDNYRFICLAAGL